jgi:hypothetical protein
MRYMRLPDECKFQTSRMKKRKTGMPGAKSYTIKDRRAKTYTYSLRLDRFYIGMPLDQGSAVS